MTLSFEELCREELEFSDRIIRNIKGIRESQALFDDLSADPQHQAIAASATLTHQPSQNPLITRPFDYGVVITYPFMPENWQSTRFSDGTEFGVWYGALDLKTTVYETAYHWKRFILASFPQQSTPIWGERRVFTVHCTGTLVDLRNRVGEEPRLIDPDDYRYTQSLGLFLYQQKRPGLLTASARYKGHCAAILDPSRLEKPVDVCYLSYRFEPQTSKIYVERKPGRRWLILD